MKHKQNNAPNGFRIGWFIPFEAFMMGTLLWLSLVSSFWTAIVAFFGVFLPIIVLIRRYSPQDRYDFGSIPKVEDFALEEEHTKAYLEFLKNKEYLVTTQRSLPLVPTISSIMRKTKSFQRHFVACVTYFSLQLQK